MRAMVQMAAHMTVHRAGSSACPAPGSGETRGSERREFLSLLLVLGKSPPNAECSHTPPSRRAIDTPNPSGPRHCGALRSRRCEHFAIGGDLLLITSKRGMLCSRGHLCDPMRQSAAGRGVRARQRRHRAETMRLRDETKHSQNETMRRRDELRRRRDNA
jgi:hypothetical protein